MNTGYNIRGFCFILLFSISCLHLNAQETPILVDVQARLETVLMLNMTPESYLEFGIKKINDNLYQITKQPDDVLFSVESTGNWNLSIASADGDFTGIYDSTHKIPVDFIGLQVENLGENWDNGLFSNIANATKDTIVYLSPERTMLLENGVRGNIGGASKNAFLLRWKFFYEDEALKTRRFSEFDVEDDTYTVGFIVTLSESQPFGKGD